MDIREDDLSAPVDANPSFAKRYFTSAVSVTAFVSFALAVVTAWISTGTGDWWKSYLQDLSTTFVGIAATVWIINFLIEKQAYRLSAKLRESSERAALHLIRHFIKGAPSWLPSAVVPDRTHRYQFQSMQGELGRLRMICDSIAPGTGDIGLQRALDGFRLNELAWTQTLENLDRLIGGGAPEDHRASEFNALKERTESLLGSARMLDSVLSKRHKQMSSILELKDE